MTRYRLTKPHYLRHNKAEAGTEVLVEAGEVIEWEGPPSLGMEAVDDEGRAKCRERDEKRDRSKQQAVQSGRMSQVTADNIGPKPEPTTDHDDDDDDDDDDKPHKRGTAGRSKR
jgi:hypothetical protein